MSNESMHNESLHNEIMHNESFLMIDNSIYALIITNFFIHN